MIARLIPGTQIEPTFRQAMAEFRYDPADPLAVQVATLYGGGDEVVWVFSRDLLDQGLRGHAGLGDVRLWPSQGQLVMVLESPAGRAVFLYRHDQVRRFLLATARVDPLGGERVDLDGLVDELLGGAA